MSVPIEKLVDEQEPLVSKGLDGGAITAQALNVANQYLSLVQKLGYKPSSVDELFCKHFLVLIGNKAARDDYEKNLARTSKIRAAAKVVRDICSSIDERSEDRLKNDLHPEAYKSFVYGLVASKYYSMSVMIRVYSAKPEDEVANGLVNSEVLPDFREEGRGEVSTIDSLTRERRPFLFGMRAFVDGKDFMEARKLWAEFEKEVGII